MNELTNTSPLPTDPGEGAPRLRPRSAARSSLRYEGIKVIAVRFAACFATLLVSLVATQALADGVSTTTRDGFARIYFTLDSDAQSRAQLVDGVLTLTFNRKLNIESAAISQGLESYVTAVREDSDGQTFRLALSQRVRLHTSTSGNAFAVDLAPDSFFGTPPDLSQPGKDREVVNIATLPQLEIRAGAYSNYTRLVFDWPRFVKYTVFPGAGRVTVRFEALARPDFAALEHLASPWVKRSAWRVEGGGIVLEFETDADSHTRDFRNGQKVTLDILAPKTDIAHSDKAPREKKKGDTTASINLSDASTNGNSSTAQESAVAEAVKALDRQVPQPAAAEIAKHASVADTSPKALSPKALLVAASNANAVQTASSTDPGAAQALQIRDGVILSFPGASTRPAAVFVRGMTAWIVIDGAPAMDPVLLKASLGDFPASVDASNNNGVTVLRIGLRQREEIAARSDRSNLEVILAPHAIVSAEAIGFVRNDDSRNPTLTALIPGAAHRIVLSDPAAGDTLVLVPAAPGRATLSSHVFADFAALPTALGLAITPFTDDLDVAVADSRVTISRPRGLALTAASPLPVDTPAGLVLDGEGPCFLDLAHWVHASNEDFLGTERRLRANTAAVKAEDAERARMALAQFYLSHDFAAEALGLIDLMSASNPIMIGDQRLQTMRAAADFMMGRYRDAHNDLAGTAFDNNHHAAFWRGLTEAALLNWEGARKALAQAGPVIHRYPADWQARARIASAQAELAAGAVEAADAEMSRLPHDLSKPLSLEAELVRGRLYAQEGRNTEAASVFNAVESSGDERLAVQASFEAIEAGLAAGSLSQNTAIPALETLRYRWRGDSLELQMLRALGGLYFAKSRWREGLGILRIASQNFAQDDLARQAQDEMRASFEELFLKGKADAMPPIEALALFYDFIDLTPIGPNGDEMIRHMADRLVAVDLLEPAATLLQYQVTRRLDGVARAQVATRLAMIDLMAHKPKDALEALRSSQIAGLPNDVGRVRTLLQARSLAALKQWDQAVDLIALDDTAEARRLRADIYWESGNWEAAAQKAEELVGAVDSGAQPLSTDARQDLMRAAIAFSLAGDEAGLSRLRTRYFARMNISPDSTAFAVVTEKLDTQRTAFRNMAGQVASIDTLEAFMLDFRKQYETSRGTN